MATMKLFYISANDPMGESLSMFAAASSSFNAVSHYVKFCAENEWEPGGLRIWRLPAIGSEDGILDWRDQIVLQGELIV